MINKYNENKNFAFIKGRVGFSNMKFEQTSYECKWFGDFSFLFFQYFQCVFKQCAGYVQIIH